MSQPTPAAKPEVLSLPQSVRNLLGDAKIRLELHCISFSHYCERARWYLRLAHVPYVETGKYLPLGHMRPMIALAKRFRAKAPAATASSQSPAVTPTLAVYDSTGTPIELIRNSALIGRFAQLHAAACHGGAAGPPPGYSLYGPGLTAGEDGQSWTAADPELYRRISELELRLSNVIGLEVRRVIYFYVLPNMGLSAQLFRKNSSGPGWWATLLAFLARLVLRKLLAVNQRTVARGLERLLTEFDYFDELLTAQAQAAGTSSGATGSETQAGETAAAAADKGSPRHHPPPHLPFYLVGQSLTAADVSLATLLGPLLPVTEMGLTELWWPPAQHLPKELRDLSEAVLERPVGRYVLRLWQVHGPLAAARAAHPL